MIIEIVKPNTHNILYTRWNIQAYYYYNTFIRWALKGYANGSFIEPTVALQLHQRLYIKRGNIIVKRGGFHSYSTTYSAVHK